MYRAHQTRWSGDFFALVSMKSLNFCQKAKFSSPCQSFQVCIFFTNNHTFSSIFTLKEFPCSWNLTRTWFDVQYFIPNSLIASFLRSLWSTFVLWKVGEHAVVGKETLKFWSIFGRLPAFPSLRPKVKRERSQVALFLLCVVSPDIYISVFTLNFLPYKPTGPISSNIYRPTINSTGPNLKTTLMTIK